MFLVVVIVGIGYWGIRPQLKAYVNLQEEIEEEQAKAELNEMKVMNLGLVMGLKKDYEEKIALSKDEFYPIMKSSEVDKMMTALAREKNLEIFDLRFSMPSSPSARMPYQYSSLYATRMGQIAEYKENAKNAVSGSDEAEDDIKALSGDKSDEDEDSDDGETMETLDIWGDTNGYHPNTDVYAVPVTMTVGGPVSNLNAFIDTLLTMEKKTLVTSYSWGEYRNIVRRDENGQIIPDEKLNDGIERRTLSIRLELYMIDTTEVEQSTDESAEESEEEE